MNQQIDRVRQLFILTLLATAGWHLAGCAAQGREQSKELITPLVITERVKHDSDDPAIWIHPTEPSRSLIIGTDKDSDGALFVFDLEGRIIPDKTVRGLKRPNNVDVEYGLVLKGEPVDIAVVTERLANKIRIYRLPQMVEIRQGGVEVFAEQAQRDPMGVALYKRPRDGSIYAIVGRKSGPTGGGYLWQYRLEDDGAGGIKATKVREFGIWSGKLEIEAIAVDDHHGYVYYADEGVGIRKYHADPDAPQANAELALFGSTGLAEDREGISIYEVDQSTGYILVSDQGANRFHIYRREGEPGRSHQHQLVKTVMVKANNSDGSEVTSAALNAKFPVGLFVAMSDEGTFHFYSWKDIAGSELKLPPHNMTRGLKEPKK
jgi:3-phytase